MSEQYSFEDFKSDWQASQAQGIEYHGARHLDRRYWEFKYFERKYGKCSKANERSFFTYCVHCFLSDCLERLKEGGLLSRDMAHGGECFEVNDNVFRELLTFPPEEILNHGDRVLKEILKRLGSRPG